MITLSNHLWQSTLFAALAFALTILLRRHRAGLRFGIWLAASLKFLVPFSLLTTIGNRWQGSLPVPAAAPALIQDVQAPFHPVSTLPIPDTPAGSLLTALIPIIWVAGTLLILAAWFLRWIQLRSIRLSATAISASEGTAASTPVPVLESETLREPGIYGIFRPVLLLPQGIRHRLSSAQFEAILAHEFAHVARRDNLTFALHMAVEAIFWFHPLVWWIGARLLAERENACDEAVLQQGNAPQTYAEGIVTVCRTYLESPLPCASGVTGADLKQRIRAIMNYRPLRRLSITARAGLAGGALLMILLPLAAGIAQNRPDTLKFEVASIRESKAADDSSRLGPGPGGALRATNMTVLQLITFAYGIREFQLSGGPGWASSMRFDVLAKPDQSEAPPDLAKPNMRELESMMSRQRERMRNLLAERFQLMVRRDTKELPVYALTVAKGGHRMQAVAEGSNPPHMQTRRTLAKAQAIPMRAFAEALSGLLSRRVIDETGLPGVYDFEVQFANDRSPDPANTEPGSPSLFTALQEQLGLKLESKRAAVETVVIERLEKPSEN